VGVVPAAATSREAVPGLARNVHRQASAPRPGVSAAAAPHGAIFRLTREGGRRAVANVHTWTEGVPVFTTPRGAVLGLAHNGGSRAQA
jgi:hypothetical protein